MMARSPFYLYDRAVNALPHPGQVRITVAVRFIEPKGRLELSTGVEEQYLFLNAAFL